MFIGTYLCSRAELVTTVLAGSWEKLTSCKAEAIMCTYLPTGALFLQEQHLQLLQQDVLYLHLFSVLKNNFSLIYFWSKSILFLNVNTEKKKCFHVLTCIDFPNYFSLLLFPSKITICWTWTEISICLGCYTISR